MFYVKMYKHGKMVQILGLGLYITDRFSGEKQYCNLRKPLWDMFSDSNTIYIRFKKEQDSTKSSTHTQSSREGFKVIYRTFRKNMAYLVDSHKTIVKGIYVCLCVYIFFSRSNKYNYICNVHCDGVDCIQRVCIAAVLFG